MKQLVTILAVLLSFSYVSETNADEPEASSQSFFKQPAIFPTPVDMPYMWLGDYQRRFDNNKDGELSWEERQQTVGSVTELRQDLAASRVSQQCHCCPNCTASKTLRFRRWRSPIPRRLRTSRSSH